MACSPVPKVGEAAAPSAPPVPTPMRPSVRLSVCSFIYRGRIGLHRVLKIRATFCLLNNSVKYWLILTVSAHNIAKKLGESDCSFANLILILLLLTL